MQILDGHAHAFPDQIAPWAIEKLTSEARRMPMQSHHDGSAAGLLASMDRAGVQRSILCSVATRAAQVTKITDWSASVASDRLIPFASIHPELERPEAEIERIASLGLRGIKFHPQYMSCALDDPRAIRIARAAASAGLAMVAHAGCHPAFDVDDLGSPRRLRRLHDAVPDLPLMGCHLGGLEQWDEVLELVVGSGIYLETSFALEICDDHRIEQIIERHGLDLLVFGTDSPWNDPLVELERMKALHLTEEQMHRALWENGHRFLGLVQ